MQGRLTPTLIAVASFLAVGHLLAPVPAPHAETAMDSAAAMSELRTLSTCPDSASGAGGAFLYVPDLGMDLEDLRDKLRAEPPPAPASPCWLVPVFPGSNGAEIAADTSYSPDHRMKLLQGWLDRHPGELRGIVLHGYGSLFLEAVRAHPQIPLVFIDPYGTGNGLLLGEPLLNEAVFDLQHSVYKLVRWVFPYYAWLTDPIQWHDRMTSLRAIRFEQHASAWRSLPNPSTILITGTHPYAGATVLPDLAERLPPATGVLMSDPREAQPEPLAWTEAVRLLDSRDTAHRKGLIPIGAAVERLDGLDRRVAGFTLALFVLMIALLTTVSEDLAMVAAGLLAASGTLGFGWAVAASWLGVMLFDLPIYMSGRLLGRPALSRVPIRWFLNARSIALAEKWTQQWGSAGIYLSRLVPGSRFPVYFMAGALGMGALQYATHLAAAGFLSSFGLVGVSQWLGKDLLDILRSGGVESEVIWTTLAVLAAIYLAVRFLTPYFRYKSSTPSDL